MRETIEPTDSEPDPAARESDDLATLEVATYFRAGGQGTVVGGDWYDVIELPDGCTALVIGDVMGRGVRASAVMTQVRDVVRTYARMGVSPLELMGSLDHLVAARFPEHFVTCVYAVFDHADLSLQLVNAGHVPPLLTHPDGSCTRVTAAPHPPLGVGRAFEDLHRVVLSPGAGLVLYTDGLVERRRVDVEAGIESLRRTVAGLDVPVREAPEAIVHAQLPVVPDDDVAMLVVRVGSCVPDAADRPRRRRDADPGRPHPAV